jgi:competence protein ComGC
MLPNSIIGIFEFLLFYYAFPIAVVLSLIAAMLAFAPSTRKASWLFAVVCIVFCTGVCLLAITNLSQNHSEHPWEVFFGGFGKLLFPMIGSIFIILFDSHTFKNRKTLLVALLFASVLVAIAIPNYILARTKAADNSCIHNLQIINEAKQEWALMKGKATNDIPTWDELRPYWPIRQTNDIPPICPQGGTYTIGRIDEAPKCSIGGNGHSAP